MHRSLWAIIGDVRSLGAELEADLAAHSVYATAPLPEDLEAEVYERRLDFVALFGEFCGDTLMAGQVVGAAEQLIHGAPKRSGRRGKARA